MPHGMADCEYRQLASDDYLHTPSFLTVFSEVRLIYSVVLVSDAERLCYIHTDAFFSRFLSIKVLTVVLCATRQVLVVYPFYT